uniref:Lipid droplet-associated hydrolase n=1 Tax=Syphacia muris TaxID=451379 RepID=A0A0N5ASR3_9BILA
MASKTSEKWVLVGDKWTKITVISSYDTNQLTVIFLGNPGNGKYYEQFSHCFLKYMKTLGVSKCGLDNEEIDHASVYIISYLNHVIMPDYLKSVDSHKQSDRFGLFDQVQHKVDFCKQYLLKNAKLILIGHSIGAYIMLRLAEELLSTGYAVVRAFGLFPTIERMKISPMGRRLYPLLTFLNSYDSWLAPITSCIKWLPDSLKRVACKWHFTNPETPQCVFEATHEILDVDILRNIIHLAVEELETVGWGIDIDNCEHAFVIESGEVVAKKLMEWL